MLYGTAWKEERTAGLALQALKAGFRGIDTANQRRHYHEAAVGAALERSWRLGGPAREQLFLQTKFSYPQDQDRRLPYDPAADVQTQVRQSFASSLEHLGVERLDGYLLHGPSRRRGLSDSDRTVWRTMEDLHRQQLVKLIGVSNVTAEQLDELCDFADVAPAFVQNRCFARFGWDREVRAVCQAREIVYQGFSLLTANRAELHGKDVAAIAEKHGVTIPQVVFRFALQLGMICLTGTSDADHMREDLGVFDFELAAEEVTTLERISA
jgi:diketogulonate reductase-like aldo/keto reductase